MRRWTRRPQTFAHIIKIGRTHTQDATPLTLGQEFSGYAAQVASSIKRIELTLPGLCELAQGGTAVGTGLNAPVGFAELVAEKIAEITGIALRHRAQQVRGAGRARFHGVLRTARSTLRPRRCSRSPTTSACSARARAPGLGELSLPENEPGSSIMPGKVNPTQCEALTQVCVQVFGNNAALTFAGSQGHFELNVYNPVMAYNFLQSVQLLADAAVSFTDNCVVGIEAREDNIKAALERSLMLVTALAPTIGYDNAAKIAKTAHKNGTTLREEALATGLVTAEEYERLVRPEDMTHPG